jgi:excisionase family DNA binding protein
MTAQSVNDTEDPVTADRDEGPLALLTVNDAARVLRLSRSVIYEQIRAGRIRVVHQGRAARIPVAAIGEYVSLLESESER